jgi:hypothetical protein
MSAFTQCGNGLICFHRDGGEPVPGCLGEDSSRNDYCIRDPDAAPTTSPTVAPLPTAAPTDPLPTISYQPSLRPSTSPAPTVAPSDFPSDVPSDFPSAIPTVSSNPTMSSPPTGVPSGHPTVHPIEGIRLKMYWEEGYLWQEETVERKCELSTNITPRLLYSLWLPTNKMPCLPQGV